MKRLHHSSNAPHAAHATAAERASDDRPRDERLVSDALQLLPAFRHAELAPAGRRAAAGRIPDVCHASTGFSGHLWGPKPVSI